jgi:two-component system, NtrC family, nitrogen regulation sensor histidine kinase NtrY
VSVAGAPARTAPAAAPAGRRPFRDNPRLIITGLALLVGALVALVIYAPRSTELYPDFLSEVVLNALVFVDFTLVCVFVFYLARNIIKLVVERRRALPFARFRAKLVAALLAMTIVPSVLVLIIGSELIRRTAANWFSAPIEEVLKSANQIAGDYRDERERLVLGHSARIARAIDADRLVAADVETVRRIIAPEITQQRVGLVEVYRIVRTPGARPAAEPVVSVQSPSLPRGHVRASSDRLAERVAAGGELRAQHDPLETAGESGGELVRAPALIMGRSGHPVGVVIASDHLSGSLATHSRRIVNAYEGYSQLRVLRRPLEGVYLSFFLLMTLMVLASATWMGVYVAKRITRPVQMLAEGARAIGSGRLDHRIEQETADEFGSLVEAFNTMAGELAVSQRRLDRSRTDLERKNVTLEESRRYIETILQRIATGVVSIGSDGTVTTVNAAATRLLGLEGAVGRPSAELFGREDLKPLGALIAGAQQGAAAPIAQEVALAHEGRELHLAAAATALVGESGVTGTVLVFDDVTPLIRAQRVAAWRDVARRLAHEIKNPLTPIQLSAERLRRHFGTAPPNARALVEECTDTIVAEVESLKALVDEFAQFARMPAPRAVPSDLNAVLTETLALYDGLLKTVRIERSFAAGLPSVKIDAEQIKRVVVNLVDNAIEAMGGRDGTPDGQIVVSTELDSAGGVARVVIADNGPGISPGDRDKLFMPYYSTKRRGSGLGLAIVRRIVVEHGGSIEVADNEPKGTRFTIELPV